MKRKNGIQPIVTVSVVTYNSSKYVVETLESIKRQTWQNLILQICDDCSTDNTIELCKKWIGKNKNRFVKTKMIIPESNTGVSANANRSWNACETEFIKSIAGDDLLFPNCIEDNMEYVNKHPDAVVVFSRIKTFSVHYGIKFWDSESWHDYNFFSLSPNEQYHYLFYRGNRLPASSSFYNINKVRELNILHDERIPLLEDYPKWIMFARKGVKFHFLDKYTVGYRQNPNSLSVGLFSPKFYKSNLLLYLYYFLDEIKDENDRDAIYNLMCDEAVHFYSVTYNSAINLKKTWDYKLGHALLWPFHLIKRAFYHLNILS